MGTLAQILLAAFALAPNPRSSAESLRAIVSPEHAWAVTDRGALWICWRHKPRESCLRRITAARTDTGAPVVFRSGRFFSPDTFVVATNTQTYVVRRGEAVAVPIDPSEQPLDLQPFRRMTCAAEGWLPIRSATGFVWRDRPCPQQSRLICTVQPKTHDRRPSRIRLTLSLEATRRVRQTPLSSQVSGFFGLTLDLGFAPVASASIRLKRARRRQARPLSISLTSTTAQLQSREAQALRRALCPNPNRE